MDKDDTYLDRLSMQPDENLTAIKIIKQGAAVDDRELELRMRKAAEGKVKINGVLRRPDSAYNP